MGEMRRSGTVLSTEPDPQRISRRIAPIVVAAEDKGSGLVCSRLAHAGPHPVMFQGGAGPSCDPRN